MASQAQRTMSPIGNKFRFSALRLRSVPMVSVVEPSVLPRLRSGQGGSRFSSNKQPSTRNREHAFTLIELLISVVVLGFGLAVVIRSFSSSISGLNASQNYVEALKFAKQKLTEFKIKAYEYGGLFEFGTESGIEKLGTRDFEWSAEVKELGNDLEDLPEKLVAVCIRLDWKEANVVKDISLATYLPRYEEEEE